MEVQPHRNLGWMLLPLIAALVASSACAALSSVVEEQAPTPLPPPTLAPPPTTAPEPIGARTATLTMVNRSGEAVCYVQISPVTDDTWGDHWLGSSETVADGARREFEVDPGDWDMRALACDQETIHEARQVPVGLTGFEWVVLPRPQRPEGPSTVRIVNEMSVDICFVRISPSTDQYWGSDWLGANVIQAGGQYEFPVPPGDTYDLRVEDCEGTALAESYQIRITPELYTWVVRP
jgi:hypothetical protein